MVPFYTVTYRVCMHVYQSTHIEVRGCLGAVGSLLPSTMEVLGTQVLSDLAAGASAS